MKRTAKLVVSLCVSAILANTISLRAADAPKTDKPAATPPAAPMSPAAAKPGPTATELFSGTLVAKGKGVSVTRGQLDEEAIRFKAGLAARGQNIPPEQQPLLEKQVLEGIIQIQILLARATDADRENGKQGSLKRLADARTNLGSEEALERQLKTAGVTREQLLGKWTEAGTAEAVLKRELKAEVADADAKKYYDEHPAEFEQPEKVRAAHILLATRDLETQAELSEVQKTAKRKQIDDLLKRARANEDFAKLVKEFSDDTGSKDNGGEYTFARASADPVHAMRPEFEAAAFSLKTNQISDVVTTYYGYHIIKLLEKIPATKMAYEKLAPDLKEYLSGQILKERAPEFMTKIEKEAGVEILDERLKNVELPSMQPPSAPPSAPPAPSGASTKPAPK